MFKSPEEPIKIESAERYLKVQSDLEVFDGEKWEKPEIEIKLGADGKPKALAFFDIDKTLAELGFIHGEAFKKLFAGVFPDEDPNEMTEVYLGALGLGTTYRVFDRIFRIYRDGREEFKDPDKYLDWLNDHLTEVDEAGLDHDLAAEYSQRHSQMGAEIAIELFENNPEIFEQAKIGPVFQLVEILQRMGIPLAVMTANDEPFARAISKCLGLGNNFISMVYQKDFEGGGKDAAIEVLIKKFDEKGIPIPENLMVVGDSLKGDIGSGAKFMEKHGEFKLRGVYVGEGDVEEIKKQVENSPNLKNMPVEVFVPSKAEFGIGRYRREFNTKPETLSFKKEK
jgi:phosphoglycolate phosphatase-like HAD superfamily hydrolase